MRMFSVLVDKAVRLREPAIPDKRLTRVNPPAVNRLDEGVMEVFTLACAASDLEAAADLLALVEKWHADLNRFGERGIVNRVAEAA